MGATATRFVRTAAARPLARFCWNFGIKGIRSVRAFERRRRERQEGQHESRDSEGIGAESGQGQAR